MSEVITKIKEEIEKAAEEKTKHLKSNYDKQMARMDFIKGANFMMPLLKKALEQRDGFRNNYHSVMRLYLDEASEIKHENDQELLELLEKR